MTDKEFAELKAKIQETMNRLIDLQKQYMKVTGRSYVANGSSHKLCNHDHILLRERGARYCENCLKDLRR